MSRPKADLSPGAVGALLHMAQATTADEAMDWCWQAHDAGATWTDCRQAYAEWERLQATQVQQIGDPMCRCGCPKSTHRTDWRGRNVCASAVCACAKFEGES